MTTTENSSKGIQKLIMVIVFASFLLIFIFLISLFLITPRRSVGYEEEEEYFRTSSCDKINNANYYVDYETVSPISYIAKAYAGSEGELDCSGNCICNAGREARTKFDDFGIKKISFVTTTEPTKDTTQQMCNDEMKDTCPNGHIEPDSFTCDPSKTDFSSEDKICEYECGGHCIAIDDVPFKCHRDEHFDEVCKRFSIDGKKHLKYAKCTAGGKSKLVEETRAELGSDICSSFWTSFNHLEKPGRPDVSKGSINPCFEGEKRGKNVWCKKIREV